MTRKKWLIGLTALFLVAGSAFAQNDTRDDPSSDSRSAEEEECHQEYQEALADAERDRDEERAEAESDEERAEAEEEYREEHAEAQREYKECLADAREDEDDERHLPVPDNHTGAYVSFDVTDAGIADYTVDGRLLLTNVSADGSADFEEFKIEGAALKLEGERTEVKIIDNPRGVMKFETEDGPITVQIADGLSVQQVRDDDDDGDDGDEYHLILRDEGGNMTAHLFVEDGFDYDGPNGTLTAAKEIRLVVVSAPGLGERSDDAGKAIARGRIAAEVDVPRAGLYLEAEYADVNVSVRPTDRGFVATVDREDPEGRTILFTLSESALADPQGLEVRFDGEPIGLADDVDDVLDPSDGVAEYLIIVGGQGTQVWVQVPHFSPHTIELRGAAAGDDVDIPSAPLAAVAAGLLGLAAAVRKIRQ